MRVKDMLERVKKRRYWQLQRAQNFFSFPGEMCSYDRNFLSSPLPSTDFVTLSAPLCFCPTH
jgi:hypothetical protein